MINVSKHTRTHVHARALTPDTYNSLVRACKEENKNENYDDEDIQMSI